MVAAHDHEPTRLPGRTAVTGQIPILVVIVGYTVAALLLLFTD